MTASLEECVTDTCLSQGFTTTQFEPTQHSYCTYQPEEGSLFSNLELTIGPHACSQWTSCLAGMQSPVVWRGCQVPCPVCLRRAACNNLSTQPPPRSTWAALLKGKKTACVTDSCGLSRVPQPHWHSWVPSRINCSSLFNSHSTKYLNFQAT